MSPRLNPHDLHCFSRCLSMGSAAVLLKAARDSKSKNAVLFRKSVTIYFMSAIPTILGLSSQLLSFTTSVSTNAAGSSVS